MGTRAYIGIQNENGTVTAIYNQCDGGKENLGHLLKKHFKTEKSVRDLIGLGFISSLQDMETYEYCKEHFVSFRGNEWTAIDGVSDCMVHLMPRPVVAEELDNIEDVFGCMIAHAYLFVPKEAKWYYTQGKGLKPLRA